MKIKSVCVYCGASNQGREIFKEAAKALGKGLGSHGFRLVYGGGKLGLMGLVADACIDAGGYVTGFIPEHLEEFEGANLRIQELYVVDSMHTRKFRMAENADAFVILPGGFGTLDELFEILTWRQLALHTKPIVILNIDGYWDPLITLARNIIQEGFAKPEHFFYISVVDHVAAVVPLLQSFHIDDSSFKTTLA